MVVISGRKMPSAEYRAGMDFFMNISTNCTSVAMTRMNAMVCMYCRSSGSRMKYCTAQVTALASAMTNTTAMPMPMAVSVFLETPKNEQQPRNWTRM